MLDVPFVRRVIPFALRRIFGSKLQVIFTGGAKLQPETREFFSNNDILICEGYGSTEYTSVDCLSARVSDQAFQLSDGLLPSRFHKLGFCLGSSVYCFHL